MKPKLVARRTLAERKKVRDNILQAEREYRNAERDFDLVSSDQVMRLYRRFCALLLREIR